MRGRSARRGITLLELLVVMALIALLAGLTYPSVSRGMDGVRLRMSADDVAAFLAQAMGQVEKTETPVLLRFLKDQGVIEMSGPRTSTRTLRLPEGIALSELLPVPPGEARTERDVMLMPGGVFPRLTVEIATRGGASRWIGMDPATGTPSVLPGAAAPAQGTP